MADSSEEKVFEPSQKKLNKLREEGQIPRSQEFSGALVLIALLSYLIISRDEIWGRLVILMRDIPFVQPPNFWERVVIAVQMTTGLTFQILLPFVVILLAAVLLTTILDVGGLLFSVALITPNLGKLNPASGIKNIFNLKSLLNLVKGIIKSIIMFVTTWYIVKRHINDVFWAPTCGLPCLFEVFTVIAFKIIAIGIMLLIIAGGIDLGVSRWLFYREQRMTLTEMKQEQKEDSGSPQVRQERQRIRREAQETAGLVGVNNASVIFTTKDGEVVGLAYKPDLLGVPIVAARGKGDTAKDLVQRAKEKNIPFFDDPALAKDLYEKGRIGQPIPQESFGAVARALLQLGLVRR